MTDSVELFTHVPDSMPKREIINVRCEGKDEMLMQFKERVDDYLLEIQDLGNDTWNLVFERCVAQ